MTKTLNKSDLRQFTGSENWYRHGINRAVLFTDGAKYVADCRLEPFHSVGSPGSLPTSRPPKHGCRTATPHWF